MLTGLSFLKYAYSIMLKVETGEAVELKYATV